jgi:hypothetical protein
VRGQSTRGWVGPPCFSGPDPSCGGGLCTGAALSTVLSDTWLAIMATAVVVGEQQRHGDQPVCPLRLLLSRGGGITGVVIAPSFPKSCPHTPISPRDQYVGGQQSVCCPQWFVYILLCATVAIPLSFKRGMGRRCASALPRRRCSLANGDVSSEPSGARLYKAEQRTLFPHSLPALELLGCHYENSTSKRAREESQASFEGFGIV